MDGATVLDEPLKIHYRDAWILVLEKPAGLLSVPGRLPEHQDSLTLRAQQAFEGVRCVHRLDCLTSGLMVFALDPGSHRHLSGQFEDRLVEKVYEAVCDGWVREETGQVDLPLIVDWPNRPRSKVDHEHGKPASTRWQVLERREDRSRLSLFPITGRSHQLRIHTAEMGHPILGDPFYAGPGAKAKSQRLLLHAKHLGFFHPHDERWIDFQAPCPF